MKTGSVVQTSAFALAALLTVGACAARAQEPPPPPTQPPPTQPPPTEPPPAQPPSTPVPTTEPPSAQAPPVTTPPVVPPAQDPASPPAAPAVATPAAAPAVPLSESELRRRRDAIYLMEGLLVNTVRLAATRTQAQIQEAVPDLSVTLFANVPPQANGFHLDEYGVVFNVIIPEYKPSAVNILTMLTPRSQAGAEAIAQPAPSRPAAREVALNPDAMYVEAVRDGLIDTMLKYGQSLELRPAEWLAIAARSAEGLYTGPVSEPSVLILRVRGGDLNDFLAGRISRGEVEKRVFLTPFSGRR